MTQEGTEVGVLSRFFPQTGIAAISARPPGVTRVIATSADPPPLAFKDSMARELLEQAIAIRANQAVDFCAARRAFDA